MKCERVEELLIDYLEGEIEPAENRLVENHLQKCHSCSARFSEFKEIRGVFQSEILPQPSQKVLETLTIKAKQDLNKEKISFWKKWFYSPVLIPTLTTALALMIWIDYKDSNQPQFDDNAEIYSREVMAEKIPSGKFADKDLALEGSGRIQKQEDSSGLKQNLKSIFTDRAVGERRRDVASAPSARTEDLPQAQIRSGNEELSATVGESSDTPSPSNFGAYNEIESYRDSKNFESESARPGVATRGRDELEKQNELTKEQSYAHQPVGATKEDIEEIERLIEEARKLDDQNNKEMLTKPVKDKNYYSNSKSSINKSEKPSPASSPKTREEILVELKNKQISKGAAEIVAADALDTPEQEHAKPQAPAEDMKKDDDGFGFSIASKVVAKKMPQESPQNMPKSSGDLQDEELGLKKTEDNKEPSDYAGLDYATKVKISEQVRSAEKTEEIEKEKVEDARFIEIDTPKEISDKSSLRQLNVALNQQKAGDCESAITTNETNLKDSPAAPDEIKEQTYLSLAQCYEQQNKYAKAIENYNYLQQVAPSQTIFATKKIQELNFKVQSLKSLDSLSEPSRSSETEVEVTK